MTTAGAPASAYATQSAYFFKSAAIVANGANGKSDIEGKAAREAVSECGQRASFNLGERGLQIFDNGDRGSGRHGREARRVSEWECVNQFRPTLEER